MIQLYNCFCKKPRSHRAVHCCENSLGDYVAGILRVVVGRMVLDIQAIGYH